MTQSAAAHPVSETDHSIELSVVIPIYNEEENIPTLYKRLRRVLKASVSSYEIIFVNDCGKDRSLEMLRALAKKDARVKVVSFARNFGHQMAITAGMDHARGDLVILMDGDLQDPPEVLPQLLAKQAEGWDVVYAVRKKRKENALKRTAYFTFYRLLKQLSNIDIPLDTGDFCIMNRRVLDEMKRLPERRRFVRGLRSWVGYKQTGFEYERAARHAGEPKYDFRGLVSLALDGLLSFSHKPLRLSSYFGVFMAIFGMLYALYVVINRVLGYYAEIPGWATVVVAVLVMGGVQMMMIGILGEYLGRMYDEIKARPPYVVGELIGFDDSESNSP